MPQPLLHKFDSFVLNVTDRTLAREDQSIPIRNTAFKLLLALVERAGQPVKRSDLIRIVWGNADDLEADNKFNVTLNAVRTALQDPAKSARLIVKDRRGYRFAAPVERIPPLSDAVAPQPVDRAAELPASKTRSAATNDLDFNWRRHALHIFVSCGLYTALYAVAVVLEVAYEFERFRNSALKTSAMVFAWIFLTSVAALRIDRKLTLRHRKAALLTTIMIFFVAAAAVFVWLTRVLPNEAVTMASFQTYPAQAAYLKDEVYFLVLALLYMIFPFHFISAMENEVRLGNVEAVNSTISPWGTESRRLSVIYPRFWALALLLIFFGVMSIIMTTHLLDNLTQHENQNLFTILVYVRGVLYFGLGIECLAWYRRSLNEIRNLRVEQAIRPLRKAF
jgi:DNA-binding winged helix-turn-helix (wHTH) protein